MDLTPYELTMRVDEFWKTENQRQDRQLELAALQACWIINSQRTRDELQITPDLLLGRKAPEEETTTTQEDYEALIRHIEGVN